MEQHITADEIKHEPAYEVKTIVYKRVHNLGNYNTEHMEMVAELTADDDADECAADLKARVERALGLSKVEPKPQPKPQPASANNDEDLPW